MTSSETWLETFTSNNITCVLLSYLSKPEVGKVISTLDSMGILKAGLVVKSARKRRKTEHKGSLDTLALKLGAVLHMQCASATSTILRTALRWTESGRLLVACRLCSAPALREKPSLVLANELPPSVATKLLNHCQSCCWVLFKTRLRPVDRDTRILARVKLSSKWYAVLNEAETEAYLFTNEAQNRGSPIGALNRCFCKGNP